MGMEINQILHQSPIAPGGNTCKAIIQPAKFGVLGFVF
jgi:hypothetical protein